MNLQERLRRLRESGPFVIPLTLLLSILPISIVYMIYFSRKKIYTFSIEGIVKGIHPGGRRSITTYIVEYSINGVSYFKNNIELSGPIKIGDKVTLCYNSKNPNDIVECKTLGLSTWFVVAYICLLFIGTICIAWIIQYIFPKTPIIDKF